MSVEAPKPKNGHTLDAGLSESIERELRGVPCCARIAHGSWCNRPDGHEGEHAGAAPLYGPLEERPPLWRSRKGKCEK